MKDELKRRDLLKGIGALSIGSLAGCNAILGGEAPNIKKQANQTQQRLKSQLPWNSYDLEYNVDSLNVGMDRLGSTGVEGAAQYRINMKVSLSENSDDLDGWLSSSERRAEFFSLLNETTYDMLNLATEDFSEYEPSQQPSHRNQVIEYELKINAESCSYLRDSVPVARIDDILSSRTDYSSYVDNGAEYEINIETGFLGTDLFC
jgi:hypothetical protein